MSIIELAESEALRLADGLDADAAIRFWELLYVRFAEKAGKAEDQQQRKAFRMSDAESKAFDSVTVPWGQFKGKRVADVPLDYWIHVTEAPDAFKEEVKRYLRSGRIQHELGLTEDAADA